MAIILQYKYIIKQWNETIDQSIVVSISHCTAYNTQARVRGGGGGVRCLATPPLESEKKNLHKK